MEKPPDGLTPEEWEASLIPDTFGLPTCRCGNRKSFGQVGGMYMCNQCLDQGIWRWFSYDPESKRWVEQQS
jgi:hypothetical protein